MTNNANNVTGGQYMLKNKNIVVISLQPWYYEYGSNCKNIALQLAENNRVLYINAPINRRTYLSNNRSKGVSYHCEIIKRKEDRIKQVAKTMWVYYPASIVESINWLPSTSAFSAANYFNNRRFAKDISYALQRLNFSDIILFNDNDIYNGFYLKELLKPSVYIYYCRDFLQGFNYWKKHTPVLEPRLIKKADIVVTNSFYYADYCSRFNKNTHYIGQGCNVELFDANRKFIVPEDVKNISSPVIGYVGALDAARLDETIIEKIALTQPEWNIVLVGPEDAFFKKSRLHLIPNIHFIGAKPIESLPDYINTFDVCINPQLKNEITKGNYPLKIDEYLALGKPVVSTKTLAMKLFEPYAYLAEEPADYIPLIEKALKENNEEKKQQRIAFAREHTWKNSVNALQKVVVKDMEAKHQKVAIA